MAKFESENFETKFGSLCLNETIEEKKKKNLASKTPFKRSQKPTLDAALMHFPK